MTDRTGLGPLEVALLGATAAMQADRDTPVRTTDVLLECERADGYGPSYALPVLRDLGTWWRTHLNLFDLHGNWGTVEGDPPADPEYTEVRLSAAGWLTLGAERRELGPVPVGLVNGTHYRGGLVPPLSPRRTIALLHRLVDDEEVPEEDFDGLIAFPTGGTLEGDLRSLYGGHRTRMLLGSRIAREHPTRLVITGIPPGTEAQDVLGSLNARFRSPLEDRRGRRLSFQLLEHPPVDERMYGTGNGVVAIDDEGRYDDPIRIVLDLAADADADAAEAWARSVWPVTIHADLEFPGGLDALVRDWAHRCAEDRTGLDELTRLV